MVPWYRKVFREAHARGLGVVQKNGISRVRDLLHAPGGDAAGEPDAVLIEECAQFHECRRLNPWDGSGKAVWEVEYRNHFSPHAFKRDACPAAEAHGRFAMLKREPPDGGYRVVCEI